MKKLIFASVVASAAMYSCTRSIKITNPSSETPNLPAVAYNYAGIKVDSFRTINDVIDAKNQMAVSFNGGQAATNLTPTPKITNHGATLGRVLFYDKKLSLNNTVSCGSCHHQDKAFTDGEALSKGFEGRITSRSTMAISNPVQQNNLFWDSRSKDLMDLALRPVGNHIEMGMDDMNRLVTKLSATSYYPDLFLRAYGSNTINKERIADALTQFVSSIVSTGSRFDKFNASNPNFNPDPRTGGIFLGNVSPTAPVIVNSPFMTRTEQEGMILFNNNCSSCHSGANMVADDGPTGGYGGGGNGSSFSTDQKGATNIGLDLVYSDNGLGNGKFKIPSLRNIALTAPYMHDGRFKTLEQVMRHYTHGIKPHPQLDAKFKGPNSTVKMINLNNEEVAKVIAFLNTLTDNGYTQDVKYADPFR